MATAVAGLRAARERRALTQEALARSSGVSRRTIGELEAGRRGAYPSTLSKLARALEVEPGALIDGPGASTGEPSAGLGV